MKIVVCEIQFKIVLSYSVLCVCFISSGVFIVGLIMLANAMCVNTCVVFLHAWTDISDMTRLVDSTTIM